MTLLPNLNGNSNSFVQLKLVAMHFPSTFFTLSAIIIALAQNPVVEAKEKPSIFHWIWITLINFFSKSSPHNSNRHVVVSSVGHLHNAGPQTHVTQLSVNSFENVNVIPGVVDSAGPIGAEVPPAPGLVDSPASTAPQVPNAPDLVNSSAPTNASTAEDSVRDGSGNEHAQESTSGSFKCPSDGVFPGHKCATYFECKGGILTVRICPPGQGFSATWSRCTWAGVVRACLNEQYENN